MQQAVSKVSRERCPRCSGSGVSYCNCQFCPGHECSHKVPQGYAVPSRYTYRDRMSGDP